MLEQTEGADEDTHDAPDSLFTHDALLLAPSVVSGSLALPLIVSSPLSGLIVVFRSVNSHPETDMAWLLCFSFFNFFLCEL